MSARRLRGVAPAARYGARGARAQRARGAGRIGQQGCARVRAGIGKAFRVECDVPLRRSVMRRGATGPVVWVWPRSAGRRSAGLSRRGRAAVRARGAEGLDVRFVGSRAVRCRGETALMRPGLFAGLLPAAAGLSFRSGPCTRTRSAALRGRRRCGRWRRRRCSATSRASTRK